MLAFPNKYSVGITSLGYQIIWATLASRKDVYVKRLFTDMGDKPHKKIDLFGLSLSWELDAPILIELLENQKIPIWANNRNENDPIVFGGGPVLTANPEPMALFFDAILLGEGEELLPKFIDCIKECKGLKRSARLKFLAQIPGIYVPSLYKPIYDSEGHLMKIEATEEGLPKVIQKQTWKSNLLSHSKVITPDSVWPNIHMVEVVRSCPELCRFCLASYLTLPFRTPSLEESIMPAIETGLKATKRLGLLGASVSQHPQFMDVLKWLKSDRFKDIRLSISSVRAATVNLEMIEILKKRGSNSITMAIESGSERIRNLVNKKLSEEEINSAARYTLKGGMNALKFYGMVGLPSEEDIDINATIDLLLNLKNLNPRLKLILGISTFVPKAHTPFQWQGVNPKAKKRLQMLNKKLSPKGIEIRPESYGWSLIQALISRSDRRLGLVFISMKGVKNSLGNWKKAYKEVKENYNEVYPNLNMPNLPSWDEVIHENWETCRVLPWDHIEGPLKKEKLIQHQKESFSNYITHF